MSSELYPILMHPLRPLRKTFALFPDKVTTLAPLQFFEQSTITIFLFVLGGGRGKKGGGFATVSSSYKV